ncbi:AMP-binding protein [Acidaminococcus timonensis]|uniref:AMP-binding protein n=1 Tax=Acidaminococcus timonensis TaxID=1871002 RepID=UPI0025D357AE|nr:AMP-binding protein [Acidaminococcus timonensis]
MDYAHWVEHWAAVQPSKPFFIEKECRYTYEAVWRAMQDYARQFRGRKRSTLLIVRRDPVEQLIAFLGAETAGWVPVLGHPDLSPSAADELCRVRHIGWIDDGTLRPGDMAAPVPSDTVCMGVLSSGSTGLPKLYYRTYESWAGFIPEQNRAFQIDGDTLAFVEGSMSFTGNLSVWSSVVVAGATLLLATSLHSRLWAEALARYPVTLVYLVPVKLKLLLGSLRQPCRTVKTVMAGSQLLEGPAARRLKHVFPHSQLWLYYGASELDYITWLTYEELLAHPGSVGRPCPGVKVECRDGLIYIDTPYHVEGLAQPCTLGDRGYFDEDGYLIFQGRAGQVINKGGFTLSCCRVEQALLQLTEIRDACVVPVKDEKRGEDLGAAVVLEPGTTLQQVRKALRQQLLSTELPGYWKVVDELPLSAVGKVDQKQVIELFKGHEPGARSQEPRAEGGQLTLAVEESPLGDLG